MIFYSLIWYDHSHHHRSSSNKGSGGFFFSGTAKWLLHMVLLSAHFRINLASRMFEFSSLRRYLLLICFSWRTGTKWSLYFWLVQYKSMSRFIGGQTKSMTNCCLLYSFVEAVVTHVVVFGETNFQHYPVACPRKFI